MSKIDRQREHQANERTFLAWLRTSIALIGFGFALARFGLFLRQLETTVTKQLTPAHSFISSQSLGVGLVFVGIIIIIFSLWRYNQVFWQIERGDYRPSRLLVWVTAAIAILLGILSFPLLIWREPSTPDTPSPRSSRTERYPEKHAHKLQYHKLEKVKSHAFKSQK
jgi:putative membrane protein